MDKRDKFIDWLCGKGKFPFFQDRIEVSKPEGLSKCGVKDCEEYAITEIEMDAPGNFVKMCEGHSSFYLKEMDLQENRAMEEKSSKELEEKEAYDFMMSN